MLKQLEYITSITKKFRDDYNLNDAFEQFKLTQVYDKNSDYVINFDHRTSEYNFLKIPNCDNNLKEYIETLRSQSFDGWSEDEIAGYLNALTSIETKIL